MDPPLAADLAAAFAFASKKYACQTMKTGFKRSLIDAAAESAAQAIGVSLEPLVSRFTQQ